MKKLVLIGVGILLLNGCANEQGKKQENEIVSEDGLHLNNGEKWQVNPETHEGMKQLKVILENADPLTLDDFHSMGNSCTEQTNFIITNCSMKGEEHNQLHLVLHPILEAISELKESSDLVEANDAIEKLSSNLNDYFEFFKL